MLLHVQIVLRDSILNFPKKKLLVNVDVSCGFCLKFPAIIYLISDFSFRKNLDLTTAVSLITILFFRMAEW